MSQSCLPSNPRQWNEVMISGRARGRPAHVDLPPVPAVPAVPTIPITQCLQRHFADPISPHDPLPNLPHASHSQAVRRSHKIALSRPGMAQIRMICTQTAEHPCGHQRQIFGSDPR
jgi:hypothetical protein